MYLILYNVFGEKWSIDKILTLLILNNTFIVALLAYLNSNDGNNKRK